MWVEQARAALLVALEALDHCIDAPPTQPAYTARTDRIIEPKPTLPTLGPAGFSFTDQKFGRRILRVTDDAGGLSWHVATNAHVAAWNADSSKFDVVNSGGGVQVYSFDPQTFSATRLTTPYSQTEPEFSRVDPDILYTVGGAQTRTIRTYALSTGHVTDVLDLDELGLPNLSDPRTYCGGVLAAGDVVCALFGGTGQGTHHYIIHGSQIFDSLPRLGYYLHAFDVDLTGRYVLLYPVNGGVATGIPQTFIWDTHTDTLTQPPSAAGHGSLGYRVMVNQDVVAGVGLYDAAQWVFRDLATPTVLRNLIDPVLRPEQSEGWADHTSWNHARADRLVPIISSTYRTPINHKPWRAWDDEIIAIDTSGAGTVCRFGHHRSDANAFTGQPIVNVSPNGKYALFTSNWEGTLGAGRTDVFLIELT